VFILRYNYYANVRVNNVMTMFLGVCDLIYSRLVFSDNVYSWIDCYTGLDIVQK